MHPHFLGVALGPQFSPIIVEVADPFLLLRVHRNHRLAGKLKLPNLIADMVKLRIPVPVRSALQGFAIRLQAVVHRMQKFGHHTMTGSVPSAIEFARQLPDALAGPA